MKLKNTSVKIVNIGKSILMPGDELTCDISMGDLPSIRAMVKRGTLTIDDSEEKIAAAAEERLRIETETKKKAEKAVKEKVKAEPTLGAAKEAPKETPTETPKEEEKKTAHRGRKPEQPAEVPGK